MTYKVLLSEVYIGTMIQAAKDIGVEVIAAQETGGFGSDIQRHNWPDVRVIPSRSSWLEKTELPRDNRWFMGAQPPCAGGSMVTPGHARGGLENPKSAFKITKAYLEYAYAQKPPIIVIESVPGTLKLCGDDICRIRDEFGPEYGVAFVLDNSSHYGCVSLRKRLWHVHYRKDLFPNGLSWTRPPATKRNMEDVLKDVPVEEGHGVSKSQLGVFEKFKNLWPAMPQNEYANQFLRKSGRWDLVPPGTVKSKQTGEMFVFYESIASYRTGYAKTVPTITGSTLLIHPDGTRPLTTREYLRVNGMPDSFSFPASVAQSKHITFIGKTVSLGIAKWVFQNVVDNLKSLEVEA